MNIKNELLNCEYITSVKKNYDTYKCMLTDGINYNMVIVSVTSVNKYSFTFYNATKTSIKSGWLNNFNDFVKMVVSMYV